MRAVQNPALLEGLRPLDRAETTSTRVRAISIERTTMPARYPAVVGSGFSRTHGVEVCPKCGILKGIGVNSACHPRMNPVQKVRGRCQRRLAAC